MNDMLDLEIQSMNLEMVETTDSGTGYPSHIRNGYIGFESFSDAEEFAYAHGMDVIILHRKDGWNLWTRCNKAHRAFYPEGLIGNDSSIWIEPKDKEWFIRWVKDDIKDILYNLSLEDVIELATQYNEIISDIDNIEENEKMLAIVDNGGYSYPCGEIYPKEMMRIHDDDVNEYAIGVVEL